MYYLPPLIDCHVHFREPGLTHKADMKSESAAALAGGVSVVCDMPNTSPPTQSIEALKDKIHRSQDHALCKMFFFFGATSLDHLEELKRLWTDEALVGVREQCCGLKLYLDNSTGDLKACDEVVEKAFELCAALHIALVAHCEDAELNQQAATRFPYTTASTHSLRRPSASESSSIERAIALAEKYGTTLHIAHLSTASGLAHIRAARKRSRCALTCEVTPHHLLLTTEDYGCCGSRIKVNPPVRQVEHAEALWVGLLDGTIDCVSTDHAPHTLAEKLQGAPPPSGMPGVELVVPLLMTVLVAREWPHPTAPVPLVLKSVLEDDSWNAEKGLAIIRRTMHENPKRIFGLSSLSSEVERGIEWEVGPAVKVAEDALVSKCAWSPYANWVLKCRVHHHSRS